MGERRMGGTAVGETRAPKTKWTSGENGDVLETSSLAIAFQRHSRLL